MEKQEIIDKLVAKNTNLNDKNRFLHDLTMFRVPVGCRVIEYDFMWCHSCKKYENVKSYPGGKGSNFIVDSEFPIYRSHKLHKYEMNLL